MNSLVMAVIGDLVPPRERSRYQAFTGLVPAISLIAGPFLGGFISDHTTWRLIFYINLPIGIAAFALIALNMNLPRMVKAVSIDWLGGIWATLSTTTLLLALSWGGERFAWGSSTIIGLFAAAMIGLVLFLYAERKAKEPILPLSFFRSGIFNISSVQFMLATLSLFAGMVFIPLFLQSVRGYTGTVAGSFVIPMMLGIIITSFLSGILISKTGRYKYWPILGSALTGGGMWILGGLSMHTSLWAIMAAMLIIGLGQGAMVQVALVAGQNAVPYRFIGAATGALNFFKSLGGAFGAAIFAAILSHEMGSQPTADLIPRAYGHTFMWVLPFMAVSFLLAIMMKEKPLPAEMEKIVSGEEEAPEY
ncbi:MFS transporter [Paenibacillus sp. Y412MC10]|uniref:MFS transporter n=1 Tax=Geobacillus sp. (strain Y412MC10) TaxID=481743 RepID=UPI001642F575|nr:MFS transporter [Paenibacillus sp. Y412MC10]